MYSQFTASMQHENIKVNAALEIPTSPSPPPKKKPPNYQRLTDPQVPFSRSQKPTLAMFPVNRMEPTPGHQFTPSPYCVYPPHVMHPRNWCCIQKFWGIRWSVNYSPVISALYLSTRLLRDSQQNNNGQKPNTGCKGGSGQYIGIYSQPPACFSAPIRSPVALQKNPSKVNNRNFFFIRVG